MIMPTYVIDMTLVITIGVVAKGTAAGESRGEETEWQLQHSEQRHPPGSPER